MDSNDITDHFEAQSLPVEDSRKPLDPFLCSPTLIPTQIGETNVSNTVEHNLLQPFSSTNPLDSDVNVQSDSSLKDSNNLNYIVTASSQENPEEATVGPSTADADNKSSLSLRLKSKNNSVASSDGSTSSVFQNGACNVEGPLGRNMNITLSDPEEQVIFSVSDKH